MDLSVLPLPQLVIYLKVGFSLGQYYMNSVANLHE